MTVPTDKPTKHATIGFDGPKEVYGDFDQDVLEPDFVTYSSETAAPNRKWLAYIDLSGRDYFGIRFEGHTEEEAIRQARALWDEKRAERERKILARREAVRKTAITKGKAK